ncbi:MAG: DUF2243 domain-containing protein [Gemmatimonadales bacterium]|nr:DUF2243 domain-containing protein [Gemmatimonadales bacterium]
MVSSALPSTKRAGLILGLGLGGFVDGIVFHQIFHWHNMGSAIVPPVTMDAMLRNMQWDGWFHAAAWLLTVTGVYWQVTDARRGSPVPSTRVFTGLLLIGWGAFNLIEGLIDHQILGLHHVRDLPRYIPLYDWIFLGLGGVGLIALGWMMAAQAVRVRRPLAFAERRYY